MFDDLLLRKRWQFLDHQTLPQKQYNFTHTHNSLTTKPYLTSNKIPLIPKHHYTELNNQFISTKNVYFTSYTFWYSISQWAVFVLPCFGSHFPQP